MTEQPDPRSGVALYRYGHPDETKHAALLAELSGHLQAGLIVPCVAHPAKDSPWTSDHGPDADEAAIACHDCPAFEACCDYGISARESAGIWGGLTPVERRHRARRPVRADSLPGLTKRSQTIHNRRKDQR